MAHADIAPERQRLGWALDADSRALFTVAPTPELVAALVVDAPPDTVHVFSGIRHNPTNELALRLVLAGGLRFAIMSEPRASEGLAGLARLAQSLLTEGAIRRQVAFVLAIGRNGPPWFRRAAYRSDRIFPFGYFVQAPAPLSGRAFDGCLRVAFLGRLTRAKGIHLFLEAVSRLEGALPMSVTVAGSGPEAAAVQRAEAEARVPFRFLGAVPMAEIPGILADQDVLVVPSTTTDDGWGVVVGEALMAGAAVVATGQVGASSCLGRPGNGSLVPAPTAAALARALADLAASSERLDAASRAARTQWALAHLTGAAGARQMLAILDHVFAGAAAPPAFPPTT
ncbi:glycosyltransferase [Prosthecodimorpha staleyi]|uniref:Glycosyltransferase n=1 Tax=Prosthecodimorpha staleyi TaxID=2840188 RepID=A0A947G9Y1_9HYPH|nr:glycosyltransferase [Prosthecodimorpha staleyi]MBT9288468.1 glycosyltransferase [Prosthecodimorpha staleyi]